MKTNVAVRLAREVNNDNTFTNGDTKAIVRKVEYCTEVEIQGPVPGIVEEYVKNENVMISPSSGQKKCLRLF